MSPFPRLIGRHRAVGQHKARRARGRKVVDNMLHPSEVGVALGRCPVLPALVFLQPLAAPIGDIERRIGEDEVGLQVRMAVVVKAVAVGNLALNAPDRQVHLGQPPRSVIGLLTIDGDVRDGRCRRCRCPRRGLR